VHESSLSPCVHVILAAKIGNLAKAYELYLRTSRLDLDDYNHEADEGLHITSMAGTWMSVVEGMAGVRVYESGLEINPTIPTAWDSYTFRILYQTVPLEISVDKMNVSVKNIGNKKVTCLVKKEIITLMGGEVHVARV
jgi:maltose phosphorylase